MTSVQSMLQNVWVKTQKKWAQQARTLIDDEIAGRDIYIYKDPRVCRLAGFWLDVLKSQKIKPRVVIPYRHPAEVVASLVKRDGLTSDYAFLLWLHHMLDAELMSRSQKRVFVSFESLLNNWRDALADISNGLARPMADMPSERGAEIDQFLSPKLKHHNTTSLPSDIHKSVRDFVEPAHQAFSVLLDSSATKRQHTSAMRKLDAIREKSERHSPELNKIRQTEIVKRRVVMDEAMRTELTRTHEANLAIIERDKTVTTLNASLAAALGEKHELNLSLASSRAEAENQSSHVDAMQTSRSWRLTRPLRQLGNSYRNLPGPLRVAISIVRSLIGKPARTSTDLLRDASDTTKALTELICDDGQFVAAIHNAEKIEKGLFSTKGDPQIIIGMDTPIKSGWNRITVDMHMDQLDLTTIYADFGMGPDPEFQIPLSLVRRNQWSALFFSSRPIHALRLDPMEATGKFEVCSFRVNRVPWRFVFNSLMKEVRTEGLGVIPDIAKRGISVLRGKTPALTHNMSHQHSFLNWIDLFDFDPEEDEPVLRAAIDEMTTPPLISVVMPVYNVSSELLNLTIQSVVEQIYPYWELCIANDASTMPHIAPLLDEWAKRDHRIKVIHRAENGHISAATNSAFAQTRGEWVALLDHDDILRPHALAEVALTINTTPDAQLIYSDEDKITETGDRYDAFFKSDWSIDMFRSMNYFNHLTVHRAANIRDVGGWRLKFEGSQDYDLNLRICERLEKHQIIHIPKILYHWRAVKGSTAASGDAKTYAYDAGLKALSEHLGRVLPEAKALRVDDLPFYRVQYPLPEPKPLVSLIIPTRDMAELLKQAIDSILKRTDYPTYEILIVDNNSVEKETLDYFDRLKDDPRIRILPYPHAFNYSAINNFAVKQAKGSIIGLINNDVESIHDDWLTELVRQVARPDVGCVGAKLYYPDDSVQHGGVVLGVGGIAQHVHAHLGRTSPGYFGRLQVANNISAVTGACLFVRKEVYEKVGGLDEEQLKVAFNDIDFCIKVRELGLWNVWTPFAELYHHESASRGDDMSGEKRERFLSEIETMQTRWHDALVADPFYNINLRRDIADFTARRS